MMYILYSHGYLVNVTTMHIHIYIMLAVNTTISYNYYHTIYTNFRTDILLQYYCSIGKTETRN